MEGKLKNSRLEDMLDKLPKCREDVLIRPKIGEDCSAIDSGGRALVLTADPITAAEGGEGELAIAVCANDVASSGAELIGFMLTILAPPNTTDDEIEEVILSAGRAAEKLGAEILGGHTERTSSVNKLIVSAVAIGTSEKESLVTSSGAKAGDYLYMSKYAAIEGTYILLNTLSDKDFRELFDDLSSLSELNINLENKKFGKSDVRNDVIKLRKILTEFLGDMLSVMKEGDIGIQAGVSSMHDVTEGGILGAIYEMALASGVGCEVDIEKIPILEVTRKISEEKGIDPLRLIGSGSMLMAIPPRKSIILEELCRKVNLPITKIGVFTKKRDIFSVKNGIIIKIEEPSADELYKG